MSSITNRLKQTNPIDLLLHCLLGFVVVFFLGIFGLMIRSIVFPPAPAAPAFVNGQMVRMKAFGVTGMVIGSYCSSRECTYDVRFASMQMKIPNGGLFSNGGPVDLAPVSRVNVREFEIEAL